MQYYLLRLWEGNDLPFLNTDIKDKTGRYLTSSKIYNESYVYFEDVEVCYLSVSKIGEQKDRVYASTNFVLKKSVSSILKKMNLADGLKELPILITDKNKKTLDGVCLFSSISHKIVDSKNKVFEGKVSRLVKKWPLINSSIPENVDIIEDSEELAWFVSEKFKIEVESMGLTGFVFGEIYFV